MMAETFTIPEFKAHLKKLNTANKIKVIAERMKRLNAIFQLKLALNGIDFVTEYQFNPNRKWRSDYFFPLANLALEIEGGAFTNGRHTRGKGFIADMEKYNAMTLLGIKLLRCTPDQLNQPQTINNIIQLCKQN